MFWEIFIIITIIRNRNALSTGRKWVMNRAVRELTVVAITVVVASSPCHAVVDTATDGLVRHARVMATICCTILAVSCAIRQIFGCRRLVVATGSHVTPVATGGGAVSRAIGLVNAANTRIP